MSANISLAVFLQPDTPPALLEVLAGYLVTIRGLRFLVATQVDFLGPFAALQVLPQPDNDKQGVPWEVQIPLGYILVTAEMSPAKHPPVFVVPGDSTD